MATNKPLQSLNSWLSGMLSSNNSNATNTAQNLTAQLGNQVTSVNGLTGTTISANAIVGVCAGHGVTNCPTCMTTTLGGSSGTITLGGSSGTITLGGLITDMSSLPVGLTQQEQDELRSLNENYDVETKAIKIQKFRNLHPEMRQMVIAMLVLGDLQQEISTIAPEKSQRHLDLEARNLWGTLNQHLHIGNLNAINYNYNTWPWATVVAGLIPAGLTRKDLEEAHAQATLEEELGLSESE